MRMLLLTPPRNLTIGWLDIPTPLFNKELRFYASTGANP